MRNLKTIISRNLNSVNAEVLGQIRQRSICNTARENIQLFSVESSRNIHTSTSDLSGFNGVNPKQEQRRNYIFLSIICGISLSMFLFSFTMREHEDYVIVNSKPKNK